MDILFLDHTQSWCSWEFRTLELLNSLALCNILVKQFETSNSEYVASQHHSFRKSKRPSEKADSSGNDHQDSEECTIGVTGLEALYEAVPNCRSLDSLALSVRCAAAHIESQITSLTTMHISCLVYDL